MKKLLFLLLISTSLKSIAQDPQLLDTDWNLHELLLNDISIEPPFPSFDAAPEFTENAVTVNHNFCEEAYVGALEYSGENGFTISEGEVALVGSCGQPELLDFMANHYSFYSEFPSFETHNNPFTYEITTSGDELTLVITNGNGDVATYGNFTLGLSENLLTSTKLIYNAENESISFLGLEQETFLSIHNLTGQKLLDATLSPSETVDVRVLPKGIYFATVSNSNNQRMSRKFVKH